MAFVRDDHFRERIADRGVQQAPAEVDLQCALQNALVEWHFRGVLDVFG